jgi:hypothetical protein
MRQKTLMELARARKDVESTAERLLRNIFAEDAATLFAVVEEPYALRAIKDMQEGDQFRYKGEKGWTTIRSIHPCMGSHWRTHYIINSSNCHDGRAKYQWRPGRGGTDAEAGTEL